jgi:hypothetical protein
MGMNMTNFGQNAMMGMQGAQPPFPPGLGFNSDGVNGGGHSGGPVRRGGGRYGNRSGPYDRNPRNNQRGYNNVGGLLRGSLPPGLNPAFIAQGGGGGGGKWGDGAGGGTNAMGPREAVQGRSIKSYEDLDAQPSGGGGAGASAAAQAGAGAELDY